MPRGHTPVRQTPGPGNEDLSGSAHTGDIYYGQAKRTECMTMLERDAFAGCRRVRGIAACFVVLLMSITAPSTAEPLEYNGFATLKFEAFFSRIEGRMGLAQNVSENGTVIDFINDMGLPADNRTFRLLASVRPLEHHLLRVYGSFPELYRGGTILQRTLQTKSFTYPAGTRCSIATQRRDVRLRLRPGLPRGPSLVRRHARRSEVHQPAVHFERRSITARRHH